VEGMGDFWDSIGNVNEENTKKKKNSISVLIFLALQFVYTSSLNYTPLMIFLVTVSSSWKIKLKFTVSSSFQLGILKIIYSTSAKHVKLL
jgi:hypothetical protein